MNQFWKRTYFLWLALLLGLGLRLVLWGNIPRTGLISDEGEYLSAAAWLVEGRGFDWYQGYLWTRAPIYPLFVAAHHWLFGPTSTALYVSQIILSLLQIVFVYMLAGRLSRDLRIRGAAAILTALYLPLALYTQIALSETLYITLLLAGFLALDATRRAGVGGQGSGVRGQETVVETHHRVPPQGHETPDPQTPDTRQETRPAWVRGQGSGDKANGMPTDHGGRGGHSGHGGHGAPGGQESNLILKGVSFTAEPGMTVAIMGKTGSGKSTIINLIPRFYDVSSGRISIDGVDVRDVTLESLRAQIGIVLQDTTLFSGSIRDNIAYGRPDASDDEVFAAARAAQAHDFISAMPDAYATLIGERGVTLSGGQRQRVAIARAILRDPRILILDDSTSAVDAETEFLIQQALDKLMQGRTSFVIAQRISTVRSAGLILLLDNGRIAAMGTHEELLASSALYGEIIDSQFGGDFHPELELVDVEG